MTIDAVLHLLHQTVFGSLAAAGFGILFNFGWRELRWCAAAGALALAVRTLGVDAGWTQEAASFTAAAAVGCGVKLLRSRLGIAGNALAVAGCIPMIPGSYATQAIFGLFALSAQSSGDVASTMAAPLDYVLRVVFTIGAIGTGLSITTHLSRNEEF